MQVTHGGVVLDPKTYLRTVGTDTNFKENTTQTGYPNPHPVLNLPLIFGTIIVAGVLYLEMKRR